MTDDLNKRLIGYIQDTRNTWDEPDSHYCASCLVFCPVTDNDHSQDCEATILLRELRELRNRTCA